MCVYNKSYCSLAPVYYTHTYPSSLVVGVVEAAATIGAHIT